MRIVLIGLLCVFLQACATSSTREGMQLQAGKASFSSGDFKKSFHQLLPLAAEGKPEAEYAIGYMYYYGYGVAVDSDTGLFWMERAAKQGDANAQKALAMIHQK